MVPFDVVIPWRSDDGPRQKIFDWVLERWVMAYGDDTVMIAYGDSGGYPFSRSRTRNELADRTKNDVIVFADADTPPIRAFVDEAVEKAYASHGWCIAYDEGEYYNLDADVTARYLDLSPMTDIVKPSTYEHKLTSWAGMIAVHRDAFQKTGGYDERFVGWGHEDVAFRLALDNDVAPHERVNGGYVVHLWHPRQEATFDTEVELANRELFNREYKDKYSWRDERV